MRVTETFIHWVQPEPTDAEKKMITDKVLGTTPSAN